MGLLSSFGAAKRIVISTILFAALSLGAVLYLASVMLEAGRDSGALNRRQLAVMLHLDDALLDVSDAGSLLFLALGPNPSREIPETVSKLSALEAGFTDRIESAATQEPHRKDDFDALLDKKKLMFEIAHAALDALSRGERDESERLSRHGFTPVWDHLRAEIEALRGEIDNERQAAAARLSQESGDAILIASLVAALAIILGAVLALRFSILDISRPIAALAKTMTRLVAAHRHGDEAREAGRGDDLGDMERALQSLKGALESIDRLEMKLLESARAARLSELLVDLTAAIPGAVFRMELRPDGVRRFLFLSRDPCDFLIRPCADLLDRDLPRHEILDCEAPGYEGTIQNSFDLAAENLTPLDFDVPLIQGGKTVWAKFIANVRLLEDGAVLFNGVCLDVTEMKKQALALALAREGSDKANKAKSEFLAVVSHEIKTPIDAILGLSRLALKHEHAPRQKERIKGMLRAGERLADTVGNMLDLSRIEKGGFAPESIPFSPAALIEEALEATAENARRRNIEISVSIDESLPDALIGDPARIGRILLSYLGNAIKFSESAPVLIRLYPMWRGGSFYLGGEVVDQGVGVDPEIMGRLFQPFQQADIPANRKSGGAGLGLALSRKLAESMGGEVGVRSNPGKGSIFWFRVEAGIPDRSDSLTATTRDKEDAPDLSAYRGQRILLVDDNEFNLSVGRDVLEDAGFAVDQAENGAEAVSMLEQAEDGRYAAILMDLAMPVLNGFEAARLLRDNPRFRDIPIIAMSSGDAAENLRLSQEAGMTDLLPKPVDDRDLWRILRRRLTPGAATTFLPLPVSAHEEPPLNEFDREQTLKRSALMQIPLFDPLPLGHLDAMTTRAHWSHLVEMLEEANETLAAAISDAITQNDIAALGAALRDMVSVNGHSGLRRLVEVALFALSAFQAGDNQTALNMAAIIPGLAKDSIGAIRRYRLSGEKEKQP